MTQSQSMSKRKYFLVYTLVFAAFALGVFFLFLKKGRSMIWNQDGGPQYYPYLIYLGRWLRDAFGRALQGDFTVKMFDFTIGLGNDVGTVARTHPLEMLSAFVPAAGAETLYSVIILLRLYLAGLAFGWCASLYRPLTLHVITGSMIYVFSGFAVIFAVRHLIYGSAFIMLPLLIGGAERIIRMERGWIFSLAVFLGFICNYYFMYQATAACGLFILLRLFDRALREKRPGDYETDRDLRIGLGAGPGGRRKKKEKGGLAGALAAIGKLSLFYLLGLGMAMFVMLPVVRSLGSSARLASQSIPDNLIAYGGWRHYYRWFLNLIIPVRSQQGGTPLNYAVTAFPAIALLLGCSFRQHRVLKLSFLAGTICIFSPLCAYVLSGFSVVSNRWIFCYGFVIGMAFVVFADEISYMKGRGRILTGILAAVYILLAFYDWSVSGSVYLLWAAGALALSLAVLFLVGSVDALKRFAPPALLFMTLVSCSVNSFLCYSGRYGDMLSEYLMKGQALEQITGSEFARFASEGAGDVTGEESAFHRIDSDLVTSNRENYSLLLGYSPTSVYNSVLSGPTTYFLLETGNSDLAAIHRIQGLDSRTVSDALASVKYFITTADGGAHAPWGFVPCAQLSDENNLVLENEHPLSFGFTMRSVINGEDFSKLSALEKEQVMLDAAVLSDDDAASMPEGMELSAVTRPGTEVLEKRLTLPDTGENVKRTKDGYKVSSGGGSICFDIERMAGYEAFVRFEDFWTDKVSNFAAVRTGSMRTEFSMRGPDYIYSLNRREYYIRLGFDETDGADTLTLELPEKGRYHLAGAAVCYVPAAQYAARIDAANEEHLEDVTFSVNTVEGKISTARDCVLVCSVPFSEGWKVLVDGKEAKPLQVNVGWLGTCLQPGDHTVRFVYTTPGAVLGRWISLAAWLIFLGVLIGGRRLRKFRRT